MLKELLVVRLDAPRSAREEAPWLLALFAIWFAFQARELLSSSLPFTRDSFRRSSRGAPSLGPRCGQAPPRVVPVRRSGGALHRADRHCVSSADALLRSAPAERRVSVRAGREHADGGLRRLRVGASSPPTTSGGAGVRSGVRALRLRIRDGGQPRLPAGGCHHPVGALRRRATLPLRQATRSVAGVPGACRRADDPRWRPPGLRDDRADGDRSERRSRALARVVGPGSLRGAR